jgi:hypothetical protein
MEEVQPRRRFLLAHKKPVKATVLVLTTAALAAPFLVVGLSPNPLFSALRLTGLLAFTLIFLSIVTGAVRTPMYMVFNPRRAYVFHIATGVLGFFLAVAHGTIILVTKHWQGYKAFWIIGPVALGLLVLTIYAALDKKRLPRIWRRIHQINYLIFVAVFVKAVLIGSDLVTADTTSYVMKTLMILYMVIATAATAYRVMDYEKMAARRRRRRDGGARQAEKG